MTEEKHRELVIPYLVPEDREALGHSTLERHACPEAGLNLCELCQSPILYVRADFLFGCPENVWQGQRGDTMARCFETENRSYHLFGVSFGVLSAVSPSLVPGHLALA